MAFKFWQWKYNPPKTVTPAPPAVPDRGAYVPVLGIDGKPTPRVNLLKSKLGEMLEANDYLQQVVLARSRGIGIDVNPAADPELAAALERIYGVEEAPRFVTIDMYNRLLDSEMAALEVEMVLGKDGPDEVNSFQYAATTTITKAFENSLVGTGQFRHQIPLLLRPLKGDSLVYRQLNSQLSEYPAATVVQNAVWAAGGGSIYDHNLDIGGPLYDFLDNHLDNSAGIYASMYKLSADIGHVERDVESVITSYFIQPLDDIVRIVSLLQAMKGFLHVPRMKDIVNGLTSFVLVRMFSEVMQLRFYVDRFMAMSINPLRSMVGTVGRALASVQAMTMMFSRAKNVVTGLFSHQQGGLKGMSYAYNCGMPHNAGVKKPTAGRIAGIDKTGNLLSDTWSGLNKIQQAPGKAMQGAVSDGLTSLAAHLVWGMDESQRKERLTDDSMKKLAQRRLQDQASQLDLMCSTQALDSLIGLAQAVISVNQKGTITSGAAPSQSVEAVGRILASKQTGTGTTFAIQDGHIQVAPPEVPPVPPVVEKVLRRGGLDRVTPDDMQPIKGVLA